MKRDDDFIVPAAQSSLIELDLESKKWSPTRDEFYTNYPFFKYWKLDVNSILDDPGINIYIHIPFCIQICDYCFYMKEKVKNKDEVDQYVDNLIAEMRLVSRKWNLKNRKVNSVYVGGGTPSVLTEQQFRRLIETLHECHSIDGAEFTIEAEPGTFSKQKLVWYKQGGVNRISMGVQSFDDQIIRMSSRKHTAKQAIHSIQMINDASGFSLNIDLLSGLCGETEETWENSITTAVNQDIDMLTIYKMKAYANTNFFKKGVHKKEVSLPDSDQEVRFMTSALRRVLGMGFKPWSSFAFTRTGYQHRYIESTWRNQDLVAYGVSSFGKIGNVNYQNTSSLDIYSTKVNGNEMPLNRTYSLTYKDMIVKELLLCSVRLSSYSTGEFCDKFGFNYLDMIPSVIAELAAKGYLRKSKNEIVLTEQGLLFADFVSMIIASSVKERLSRDSIGFSY